ncbi:hypothetical protein F5887DRAFT_88531 [Amanita rubescens]|nr:hypothetical protein F5887DRAFT_88531 [Amanita rubescens]
MEFTALVFPKVTQMKAPLAILALFLAALCGQAQTVNILSTSSTNPGGPISVPSSIPSSSTSTISGVSAPSTLPGGSISTSVPAASSGGVTTSGGQTTITSTSAAATASSSSTNAASSDRIGAVGTFAGLFAVLAAAAF